MDERMLAVLVAMAKGYLNVDDFGSQCAYCYVSEWDCRPVPPDNFEYIDADLPHKPDCPINVARILLKEQGTPVNVYRMRYEYCNDPKKKKAVWTQAGGDYTIALTLDDAIKEYTDESHRNVQVEFMREVPLQVRMKDEVYWKTSITASSLPSMLSPTPTSVHPLPSYTCQSRY